MKTHAVIRRYGLLHILFWIMVGSTWYYLRMDDYVTARRALSVTLINIADLALMIYIVNGVLIPQLLYRKRYVLFVLAFLVLVSIASFYKMHLVGSITHNAALIQWQDNLKDRIYDNLLPNFFLAVAGMAVQLLFDYTCAQQRLTVLAKEKAEAELNFLKSQINPHFLFNSLNAVYFLIDKKNPEARQALHKFSEMLRYQLYEAGNEKIPIEKEIGYIRDYIGLQSLRNEGCIVQLEVAPGMKSFFIEPLLLIPFVENSFKHLSRSGGKDNQIRIGLSKDNGQMKFHVRNTTEPHKLNTGHQEGGIGLDNVRRRLQLLYPQRYHLQVQEAEGWFDVCLNIKIDY